MERNVNSASSDNRLYDIIKLQHYDTVRNFDCGDADLNDFIINDSGAYRKALLAVSYAVVPREPTDEVLAYFSLANDKVAISDFDSNTDFNRFRRKKFVNKKRLTSYPAAKICRLGVDLSMKGKYLGSFLLDFIKSYFIKDNKTGCRFLTVDAYVDAVPFYLKNGFIPISQDDEHSMTRLLYFDLNDIAEEY